ncbi:MAG: dienelactone hydrolase family protein [Caulobacteraceae bacterium]|nr:dienelactone hydrolase family protein [Caulobacteraceae bacterium]
MNGTELRYEADGLSMVGRLFTPPGPGPHPGVMVYPEAFGLGPHAIGKAQRIASELGYAALACDLHGEGRVLGMGEVMAALAPLRTDAAKIQARTRPALEAFADRPEVDRSRIAAIGFCFGGTISFELACRGADLKAAIGFHGGLAVPSLADASQVKGKVLALIGADDPSIPPDQRAAFETAMREGQVDWQMTLYGGVVHSYTNPEAAKMGRPEFARYDEAADRRSWAQMAGLLAEVFGGQRSGSEPSDDGLTR